MRQRREALARGPKTIIFSQVVPPAHEHRAVNVP